MRWDRQRYKAAILISLIALPCSAQNVDTIVTRDPRTPATVADEIQDPGERAAFLLLYQSKDPSTLLRLSSGFLKNYPASAFLAPVLEIAARSSFDLGEYDSGLGYARQSLRFLPENPLLLVALADVAAHQHQDVSAISSARDALDYLDRFARPLSIAESAWPALKRQQQATAWFVIGRAQVSQALKLPAPEQRKALLELAAASLSQARRLNPDDQEIPYLLAIDLLANQQTKDAAREFAGIVRHGGDLAAPAREQMRTIYEARHDTEKSFEAFLAEFASATSQTPATQPSSHEPLGHEPRQYAGSAACKDCHVAVYREWARSGMARMLRPYEKQNVIGDFVTNNQFYAGDDYDYRHGKLQITPGARRTLFAKMVPRGDRHFFDILQSDGRWHTYPVDYTIGSKWQQAYATTLPNGQIHVFPIQYNAVEKKWVNYWKIIDGDGSARSNLSNWEKLDITTSYQANCALCHTSQLRNTQDGGLSADLLVFRETGVGCEMCHGPSAAHIAAINSGPDYDAKPIDPPVDFRRISNRDFVNICAQCHLQSNLHQGTARGELNYSSVGRFFLVNESAPFNEFSRKGFYKDGRLNQTTFIVESFERSQCFRIGQASCGSCHNPHGHDEASNLTSLKFNDDPNRMCTGCHRQYEDRVKAALHSHHTAGSEGSQCVSCHMPRIMDGLLFRSRTHQIDDIPNADMTLRFGQEDSPNACLICHHEKTAQWVKSELQAWSPSPQIGED